MKAVVVGAGVVGTALSRELAGRGWEVSQVAVSAPGEAGASSAQTRLFRVGHEQDRLVDLAVDALAGWRELEQETGRRLFFETGLLQRYGSADRAGTAAAGLRRAGVDHDLLPARQVDESFPELPPAGSGDGVWEPGGGVIAAAEAVHALAESAVRRGVQFIKARAWPTAEGVTTDVGVHRGDVAVWAVGAEVCRLFPKLNFLRVVRHDSFHLRPDAAARSGHTPWIDHTAEAYYVPQLGQRTAKVVPDLAHPPASYDEHEDEVQAALAGAGHTDPRVGVAWRERGYYVESDRDEFFFEPVDGPFNTSTWVSSGDNGQAFKHAPAWAQRTADVLEARHKPRATQGRS